MKFFKSFTKLLFIIPIISTAQMCELIENKYKSKDEDILGKAKEYFNKIKPSKISKILVKIERNNKQCKSTHPILITIVNNSNLPIDEIDLRVGSWLTKKNGKSYYVGDIKHYLKDSKYNDFYIKPHTKHSFCSVAPLEEWEREVSLYVEGKKIRLIHTFKLNELDYGLVQDSCFVGFDE